jgi:hypothetical protein
MIKPYKLPQDYIKWANFLDHSDKISLLSAQKPYDLTNGINVGKNLAYLHEKWFIGYPVYCVRRSLIEEMLETDVGDNISLFKNIDLGVPTYLLCFPESTIKSPVGNGFIDYLIVDIVENDVKNSENNEYKYLIFWGCFDSNNTLLFSGKGIRWDGTIKRSPFILSGLEKDAAFLVRNIVLQSILLLQYYPEIQHEMENTTQSKGFGPVKTSEYRFPRWLGSKKINNGITERGEGQRETAKKSKHYRSHHWRLQPCGEGRREVKPVRVRGTWVNPDFEG